MSGKYAKTHKKFEEALNRTFAEQEPGDLLDQYIYLTVRDRGQHCSLETLQRYISAGQLGTLIRKYDPILFYTEFNNQ